MSDEQKIEEVVNKTQEQINQELIEEAIKNNKFEFEYESTQYRVTKPNFAQKQEAYKAKIKKYTELLKDKDVLTEEDLKKLYKERGTDIDQFQKLIESLDIRKKNLQLQLGEALANKETEKNCEIIAEEIKNIETEQIAYATIKNNLLEASLENQVFNYTYAYLVYLITEKKVNDTWSKAWSSYAEFEKSDEALVNKIVFYSALVLRDEVKL
jgi:hypothetical protein